MDFIETKHCGVFVFFIIFVTNNFNHEQKINHDSRYNVEYVLLEIC